MKKLLLILLCCLIAKDLYAHSFVMEQTGVFCVSAGNDGQCCIEKDKVQQINPDKTPCVYGKTTIIKWEPVYQMIDHGDYADEVVVGSEPVKVPDKCLSCDYEGDIVISPKYNDDGTSLDEEICPQRKLLPYEKCSALRVSRLKEQK